MVASHGCPDFVDRSGGGGAVSVLRSSQVVYVDVCGL